MPSGRQESPRDLVPGFAKLLRKRRMKLDWTQSDLAKASGISTTTISNFERERRSPSLRVAMQLARALGLSTTLCDPAGKAAAK